VVRLPDAVDGLSVRKVLAIRRLKLLDEPTAREVPRVQVGLGSLDGLGVPVGMGVVDAPDGLRVREVLAVGGVKLLDQTGLEKCPERRYDLALARASRWPIVEAWAALASGSAARTTMVTASNFFMIRRPC
jgi:hypothetical protein